MNCFKKFWNKNKDTAEFTFWIALPLINEFIIYYNVPPFKTTLNVFLYAIAYIMIAIMVQQFPRRFKLKHSLSIAVFYIFAVMGLGYSQQSTMFLGIGTASLIVYYQFVVHQFNEELIGKIKTNSNP